MNNLFLSIDLENCQPSGRIIEIGAVIGNRLTGEILAKFGQLVDPGEPISPFITQLTGITNDMIRKDGIPLVDAYNKLIEFWGPHVIKIGEPNEKFYNMMTWGGGDHHCLRDQVFKPSILISLLRAFGFAKSPRPWPFGHRELDIKTIAQFWFIKKELKAASGLAKSLRKVGLNFQGTKHRATDDALNTFRLAHWFWTH